MTEVKEPKTCHYEMKFKVPLACSRRNMAGDDFPVFNRFCDKHGGNLFFIVSLSVAQQKVATTVGRR